jgi:photosystem II stability/assembly factor-like uncharacterized protein
MRACSVSLRSVAVLVLAAFPTAAQEPPKDPFKALVFRNIGPAVMGGRIDDMAVVEASPSTFYVATASGGIWKTINNGTTFTPVFENYEVSTIGDIALAPSDPQTLYAGTGEPNNRQSSSWGNGVYRTRDGGKTWTHVGLAGTEAIGRIAVHPTNSEVAYVAALGPLWGPGGERGLFKTTDGGRTWTNTKSIDADTGFVDLAMDPRSPDTLYAASYQRRRQPFGFSGGGPGSGVFKTTDGGASWRKLTKGLPAEGDIGRIGIAVYRRDPAIVYLTVEHAKEGGIYRSGDGGESFVKMSSSNPRPSYYSKIHVDPNNDLRVFVLGAPMFYSEDGGKTFKTDRIQKIHGDYHALWIDPADSNHMFVGTDGGMHLTWDGGRSMDYVNTVPLAQFYEVSVDSRAPYGVCGGLQDNGSWCGPSRTLDTRGIGNHDWFRVGGGDGFYTVVDPEDPDTVYVESQDGNVRRFDRRRNETRNIRPEPPEGERYRFNWNSPILISPHDHKTVYYGGNRLFGSKDRGETWTLVTKDLTSAQKRDGLAIFGKKSRDFLSRNDGVVHWGTITTLAESPLRAGVLWAGTDDGNLQVSRDGGTTWTNVVSRVPGVPRGTYVSRLEASRRGEGTAYVAFDGHRGNDFKPYLYVTEDFGQTWKAIAAGLPEGGTLSVVREHPRKADVLFVGTERGLFVSWNRGGSWTRIKSSLPTVPVDDIQIHPRENDLVLGTHGRGVWILDDLTPLLEAPGGTVAKDVELFEPRGATQYRTYNGGANAGHKAFFGDNPAEGALLTYYLKDEPGEKEKVKITVRNATGEVVREMDGPKEPGLNRAAWDLRHEPPVPPDPEAPSFFGPPTGPLVPPGTYTVTVAVGERTASRSVVVQEDPRLQVSDADRAAWYEASRRAARLWGQTNAANKSLASLKKQLEELKGKLDKDEKAPEEVEKAAADLLAKVEAQAKVIDRQAPLGFAGAPLEDDPIPLLGEARGLYLSLSAITAAPTPQQEDLLLPRLEKQVGEAVASVNALVQTEVPAFNKLLLESGRGLIEAGAPIR